MGKKLPKCLVMNSSCLFLPLLKPKAHTATSATDLKSTDSFIWSSSQWGHMESIWLSPSFISSVAVLGNKHWSESHQTAWDQALTLQSPAIILSYSIDIDNILLFYWCIYSWLLHKTWKKLLKKWSRENQREAKELIALRQLHVTVSIPFFPIPCELCKVNTQLLLIRDTNGFIE